MRTLLAVPLFVLLPLGAHAQSAASVSDLAGKPDAVVLEVPTDPCAALWDKAPAGMRNLKLDFGPVALDQQALFGHYCEEKLGQISAMVTAPVEQVRTEAEGELARVQSELEAGFWKYVAEILYDRLPPEEQAKYAPGSDALDTLAHTWLNEAPSEAATYAGAYLSSGPTTAPLYEGWKIYADLTAGESKTILDQMNGLLETAKKRLAQLNEAQAELAKPDTSTADALEKVGLSGEWLETFKSHEGPLRALNADYRISDAMQIVGTAMGSKVESDKISAFFQLMELSGAIASESRLPLVSFVGDIVQQYATAANAMLDAVFALEMKIAERSGYCLGVGIASRDPRNAWFADRNVLACPWSTTATPFKHIYQSQGAGPARLFFYDGKDGFIESTNGVGRDGVLKALGLIDAAVALGYAVERDTDDRASRLAMVVNTSHPGGVPALIAQAQSMAEDIDTAVGLVRKRRGLGDPCSEDALLAGLAKRIGLNLEAFTRDTEQGLDKLTNAIAASFVAFEGGFGPGVARGANAYQTYDAIAKEVRLLSFFILEVRATDQDGTVLPHATLDVSVVNGDEVEGCPAQMVENTGRISVFVMGGDGLAISVTATAQDAGSARETYDRTYFENNGLNDAGPGDGLYSRASATLILTTTPQKDEAGDDPETGEPTGEDTGMVPAPDTDTIAPACAALTAKLDELGALVDAGSAFDKAAMAQQIDYAVDEAVIDGTCDPDAVNAGTILMGLLDTARVQETAMQDALAACTAEEIAAQSANLKGSNALLDPRLTAQLSAAQTGLAAFEEGRAAYLDNRINPAEAKLNEAQTALSTAAPYCAETLARTGDGLSNIANLRRLDGHLANAAEACDTAELNRVSGLMEGETHPAFDALRGRVAAALKSCGASDSGADAPEEADLPERDPGSLDPPLEPEPQEQDTTEDDNDCDALTGLIAQSKEAELGGDYVQAFTFARQAAALTGEPARLKGCEAEAEAVEADLDYLRSAIDLMAVLDRAVQECDTETIEGVRPQIGTFRDPAPALFEERARQAQECTGQEEEEPEAEPAPAEDPPADQAGGEVGDASAYDVLKDANDRFRSQAAQSGTDMSKYKIGAVSGNAASATVVHDSVSYSSGGANDTLHYEADVRATITITAFATPEEARPTPRAGEEQMDADGVRLLTTSAGVDGTARTSKGRYRIETTGKRLNFKAYTDEGESSRSDKDGAFAALVSAALFHQLLNPDFGTGEQAP